MNNKKSPNEIAKKLSKLYGNTFDEIIYTKGVGISGKIRFAELGIDKDKILKEVNKTISIKQNTIINDKYPGQFFSGYVWAEDLYRVINEKKYNCFLLGGDLSKSKQLMISSTFFGRAEYKNIILRDHANINDDIWVTGNLGESYAGLKILKKIFLII